jgi:hypothetical protein
MLRRSLLGITHRGTIPPLLPCAEGTQLRAQYRYGHLAVGHVESGCFGPVVTFAIPLDALAEFEGRDDIPVVIEAATTERTVVRWADHGIPQSRESDVTPPDSLEAFPQSPRTWEPSTPGLLDALAEATRMGVDDSKRYALDCVQLRGTVHKVVATDGRQHDVRSGLELPWDGGSPDQGLANLRIEGPSA